MPSSKGKADALSTLTRLSPSVYLYDPIDGTSSQGSSGGDKEAKGYNTNIRASPPTAPKIIVLFTWMSARPIHILKYFVGYQGLYPKARIIIIRSEPADILWRSGNTQRRRINPAVSAILSQCTTRSEFDAEILLHFFSNGGSGQLIPFLDEYREQTSSTLPPHIKIFDSCPGRGTFGEAINALSASFPRSQPLYITLLGLLYLFMGVYFISLATLGIPNPNVLIGRALNGDKSLDNERSRCYIYGTADTMVRWQDIKAHADEARKKGLQVSMEEFEGSGHVAHVRQDGGERYWSIVDGMWQESQFKHD